jgi:hypothetical protein
MATGAEEVADTDAERIGGEFSLACLTALLERT